MASRPVVFLILCLFLSHDPLLVGAEPVRSGMLVCVVDEEDAPLPGAAITLDGPLLRRAGTSGGGGCVLFPALEPGEWDVTADLQGRSLRHRLGVRVPPGSIVRLTLDLPVGDEIITDTDDRLLPDFSVAQHVSREWNVLGSRAGNSSLDTVLRELPTATPSWVGSFPRAGEDLRSFGPLPSSSAELRVDGVRVDGVIVGEADPDWLDPRAMATVHADDATGAPVIDMVPRSFNVPSGAVSLEWTDRALQDSSELAGLADFSRLLARIGTEMITDRATVDASFGRTRGDWLDSGRMPGGASTRLAEGWHVRSRVRWGERNTSRVLVTGGRRSFPREQDARAEKRDETGVVAFSHEIQGRRWHLGGQFSGLRARELGPSRREEDGDGFGLEAGRLFASGGADHDVRLQASKQTSVAESRYETTELGVSDYFVGSTISVLGALRWSERRIDSRSMRRVDPAVSLAWRPFRSPRRVIRAGAGRRSPDAIDVTDGDPDETFAWLSMRWEEALGEWTVGEGGAARTEALDGAVAGAEWSRAWVAVRRRYSSGYSVRGFARWLEIEGNGALEGRDVSPGSDWGVGGEVLLDLPTGWSMAVTGDLRQGLEGLPSDRGGQVGNVDLRAGRSMHPAEAVTLRVWGEVRNLLDSEGVIGWSELERVPIERQPRTLVLGASFEF